MKLQKIAGATSEIWQVFIQDSSSTTGAGLTGLAYNSGSLTAYYHRDTDTTATQISLVTMTVGTFTSSGFAEIDSTNMPGWYQFCPPNAALASGAKSCAIHLKGATNMAPLPIEVQLMSVNPDSTGFGLVDASANVVQWNGHSVHDSTSGYPDVNTAYLGGTSQTGRDIGSSVLLSSGTGTGQVSLSSGTVTVGTNNDKTGYSLTQSFPSNFSSLSIDASGRTDVGKILGTASAGTAGYVGIDWSHVNAPTSTVNLSGTTINTSQKVDVNTVKTQTVTCSAGVTVNANVGTTQPVNFTGTSSSALVKSDMQDIAGSAVSTSSAQIGVNVVEMDGNTVVTSGTTTFPTDPADESLVIAATSAISTAIGTPAVTVSADIAAVPAAVLAESLGSTLDVKKALELIAAAVGAKTSGGATTTFTIRDVDDTVDIITATVDADGNRSAITYSFP